MTDDRERCVKCGGGVDPVREIGSSVQTMDCRCLCRYPNGGCGTRIFFRVNDGGNRQPFDLVGGGPHHATCRAYIQEKNAAITCPSCGARRRRDQPCQRCGWSPTGRPPVFTVPTLDRFGEGRT